MTGGYHAGEIAVQQRAGEREMADRVGRIFQPTIKYSMKIFLHQLRMAVLGSIDARGAVWASVLTGEPGFLRVLDEETVRIDAAYVREHIGDLAKNADLSRFIL